MIHRGLNRVMAAARLIALLALTGLLTSVRPSVAEPRPRSILVLDQAEVTSPFYYAIYSGLRSVVASGQREAVSVYVESLDLDRFNREDYVDTLRQYLKVKYRDRSLGVLVTVGAAGLQLGLRLRANLWPEVPLVFCMVDEPTLGGMSVGPGVTGNLVRLRFSDAMIVARALVPSLKQIALVGDAWGTQTVFRHFKDEIPAVTAGIEVIDFVGLPLSEVRARVAVLPQGTAIIYTAMYSDGAGTSLLAREALARIAEVANAPIVGAAETFLGAGATGGFVAVPSVIGSSAGRLALRVIAGESPSEIPITMADAVVPVFDWNQLQRWGVKEWRLPLGSEIRFRELGPWDRYRWEIIAIAAVTLLQAMLIIGLLHQRRGRHVAELESRRRMAELAHMDRQATVGHLSASIAHELNQPLGAILNNVEAAALLVNAPSLDRRELNAILTEIKRDDQRASEVIKRLRRLLIPGAVELAEVDVNDVIREVLSISAAQATAREVKFVSKLAPQRLWVKGDRVQLEQVILNLVMNAIEAIAGAPNGLREIACRSWASNGMALVSIRDSGPGIPQNELARLFDPFVTTKHGGMGMGLCIARTIVEAHSGALTAESRPSGAVFHVQLPLLDRRR